MNRRYTTEQFATIVDLLRREIPEVALTTDIIVGFPGETDDEFLTTVEFAKKIGFDKAHIFPYSIREGTKAAKMSDKISNAVKAERAAVLSSACESIRKEIFKNNEGKTVSVLFETPKDGYQCGYTKNYTPVKVKTDTDLTNTIYNVFITETTDEYCIGEIQ